MTNKEITSSWLTVESTTDHRSIDDDAVSVHSQVSQARSVTNLKSSSDHGPFRRAIPCMPIGLAALCCVLNVIIPGSGTLLSAFAVLDRCETEYGAQRCRPFLLNLLAAALQALTAVLLVGWLWSIVWAVIFVNLARKWWISAIDQRDHTVELLHVPL